MAHSVETPVLHKCSHGHRSALDGREKRGEELRGRRRIARIIKTENPSAPVLARCALNYSFLSRLAPLCRRCRSTDRRVIARRRSFSTAALIFATWSTRIRTHCVRSNPSTFVLPTVKHFLLQTLSGDWIRHRCILRIFHSLTGRSAGWQLHLTLLPSSTVITHCTTIRSWQINGIMSNRSLAPVIEIHCDLSTLPGNAGSKS